MIELRPFQRRFIREALRPDIDTACLSIARGNGKSALAGYLLTRVLDPTDDLFHAGSESVLCAATLEQARICFRFARADLEPTGQYRFLDSHTRIGIVHKKTNTRLRVISSNAKAAFGLVNTPMVIADEPGAWEVGGGTLLHDAIETAKGKPQSRLQSVYIGTLAPSTAGWWHDMIQDGTKGSVYVQALRGDPDRWDTWSEIRRCNPLTAISAPFRRKLLQERDEARKDSRLKARFMSYRLNVPSGDESTMLLTVDDWQRVCSRPVPERSGRPIVGVDLGGGRAWSAATAVWRSGRIEVVAIAPGVPTLLEQEKRDRVPRGVYSRLALAGALRVSEGKRVPPVADLWRACVAAWGPAEVVTCDRFRLGELEDAVAGAVQVIPRVTRWSSASEDIRALRRGAADGPLSCAEGSRDLLTASLSASMVTTDDQGSVRLRKRGVNNQARDDAAHALVLAAGLLSRAPGPRRRRRHGLAG